MGANVFKPHHAHANTPMLGKRKAPIKQRTPKFLCKASDWLGSTRDNTGETLRKFEEDYLLKQQQLTMDTLMVALDEIQRDAFGRCHTSRTI